MLCVLCSNSYQGYNIIMDNNHEILGSRVAGLEDDVKSLTRAVGTMEADIKNVGKSVENLTINIQSILNKMQHDSRTNWATIGTWAAVMISVLGALGFLSMQPLVDSLQRERHSNLKQYELIRNIEQDLKRIEINQAKSK